MQAPNVLYPEERPRTMTTKQWRERLERLSPDALQTLRSRIRIASLAHWITKIAPKHAPVPRHLADFIRYIERAEREPVRLLVSMPPRHAKSVTLLGGLAWTIDRHPGRLNAYVTYSRRKATSKSRLCRRYAQIAGVRLDDTANSAVDWRTHAGGGLLADGIGGGLTGEGVDGLLVVDDPFKGRAEAESETIREKVWDWFNEVAYTRLNPGASCIVVATRWHHDDLIGRLVDMGTPNDSFQQWEVINYPAVREEFPLANATPSDAGFALWPERYNLAELTKIRRQVGEYGWASLYQGHPVPRGGAVFEEPARYTNAPPTGGKLVIACDPAGSVSTKANNTSLVAMMVYPPKNTHDLPRAFIIDVVSFRAETQEAATRIWRFQCKHGGAALVYENSRDGAAIVKALKQVNRGLKFHPVTPRGDKLTRSMALSAAWNDGRVYVPHGVGWDVQDYLSVMCKFTGLGDLRDDEVDATAHAWNHAFGHIAMDGSNIKIVKNEDHRVLTGIAPPRGTGNLNGSRREIFG